MNRTRIVSVTRAIEGAVARASIGTGVVVVSLA
jgi:thiamine phosphate synthase YjbQ (UPF0047 family)